jgi:hypothetical protein
MRGVPPPQVTIGGGQTPLSLVTHVRVSIGAMTGDAGCAAAMMPVVEQQI